MVLGSVVVGDGCATGKTCPNHNGGTMINGTCVVVVMPAYNAEKTLDASVREIPESVINFRRSVTYGIGVPTTAIRYVLQRTGITRFRMFDPRSKKLALSDYNSLGFEKTSLSV
jgi:hypothetical protein